MKKAVLLYGLCGGVLIAALRFAEYRFLVVEHSVEINETAARKYFPNENPIGRRFGTSVELNGQYEIVGLLHDVKYDSVRAATPPTMYVPYPQTRVGGAVFELRTAGAPAGVMGAVREAARQIDPNLPLTDVSTQLEQVEKRFAQEKLFARPIRCSAAWRCSSRRSGSSA